MMRILRRLVVGAAVAACACSAFAYNSGSYVQEGLIAHWDGIENAGVGVHSSTTEVWADLTTNKCDWSLNLGNVAWTDSGLVLNGAGAAGGNARSDAQAYFAKAGIRTIEFVYANAEKRDGLIFVPGLERTVYLYTDKAGRVGYYDFKGQSVALNSTNAFSVAYTFGATGVTGVSNCWLNGEEKASEKMGDYWSANMANVWLGGRSSGKPFAKGTLFALRVYNRELTAEERAKNRKVDRSRFLGESSDGILAISGSPYNVPVDVSPSYAGRDGLANGDTLTLTAPAGTVTLADGRQRATCTGYKLYDEEGAVVAEGQGSSHSYTHPGAYRRLEWQFEVLNEVNVTGVGGEYSVTNAWVEHGNDFTFAVKPNEGKSIRAVTNSTDGETWTSSPVTKRILEPTDFAVTYDSAYYVSPDGDDNADGTTHATAKKTIAAALACAANAGDAVVLMAGEHAQPSATVTLNRAVTVYGEEGTEKTFIKLTADVTVFSLTAAGATVRGITFFSDYKTKVGCPITISAAALAEDCVIRDAYIVHSPVYTKGASTIRNIRIEHVKGDGRYMTGFELNHASAVVEDCSVIACEGNNNDYGCPAYIWSGTIRNCLFACNTNKDIQTAGVYVAGAGVLENCTVVDNICLGSGTRAGGVVVASSGSVRNCLIAGNGNRAGGLDWSGNGSRYTCNCTTPLPSGTGNVLATSPDFTDRANKDYTLKSGNAIDAGMAIAWQATARDLAGNARVIGSAVDIGCYEYKPGALAASAVSSVPSLVGEGTVTLQAHAAGTNLTDVTYAWTVTDDAGETVVTDTTSGATFAYDYSYGRYSVKLEVRNASGETATWTAPRAFTVIPTTVYVATDSTPVYPYGTKATAANDVATALTAAIDGSTVIICDGVYPVTANIAIAKDLTVRSENGADKVALTTDKAIRVLSVSAAGARFEDVTFRSDGNSRNCSAFDISSGTVSGCVVSNFYSNGSQLVSLSGTGAIMTNCTVTANRTTGRINTVHMTGGTVTHSKIVGNEGDNNSYGAALQIYNGLCFVRNCLIASNTNKQNMASAIGCYSSPTAGSLVESCTIVGNHVTTSSANAAFKVHANLKVRNCIIVGNTNTGGDANWDTAGANISYTCTTPVPDGTTGNVEPSGVLFADDAYHIKAGILTDAGQNQAWMTDGVDLDGNARLYDGGTVDLGCYEYVPGALECSAAPSTAVRLGAGEVVLTAITSVTSADMVYTWTVSDQLGEVVAEASGKDYASFANSYPIGEYDVYLRVELGGQTAEFSQTALFAVKPKTVYVAKDSTPAYPYDTKQNAFNQVDAALDFAESGMTVVVTDGVYTNATNPTLAKDVTVVSENGAAHAVVCGKNPTTAWTLNSSGATVRGLTLVGDLDDVYASKLNRNSRQAHGVAVLRGVMADCVVTNWYSHYTEVLTAGGKDEPGVVTNCVVIGNESHYRTHFIGLSKNALMTHCRVVNNVCDTDSKDYSSIFATYGEAVLRSTLIAENRSIRTTSDPIYASVIDVRSAEPMTVESCTIVSNTSTSTTSPAIWCESNGSFSSDFAKKLTIRNCIVWGNANKAGVLDWKDIAASFTTCCCSTPGLGAGNLTDDPKLCFRNTPSHPRFSLLSDSPCIDAAAEQPWMIGAVDLLGNPRIIGKVPDIGCYECPPAVGLRIIVR